MYYIFILVSLYLNFIVNCNAISCDIISRKLWGSKKSKEINYQLIPVKYVIINHTAGVSCSTRSECSSVLKEIQLHHMTGLKWSDIGYNFMIGNDGNVYEGRGWHKVGAHTLKYNTKSIGIALIGDFNEILPHWKALIALRTILNCGIDKGELDPNFKLLAARQISSTISPGLALYNEIKKYDNWSLKP